MEKVDLEEAKQFILVLDMPPDEEGKVKVNIGSAMQANELIRTLIQEVETLQATLALHLGVAEDDPIITENEVLREVKRLRELVKLYKERDDLQKKLFYPPEDIARLFKLRTKIAELGGRIG